MAGEPRFTLDLIEWFTGHATSAFQSRRVAPLVPVVVVCDLLRVQESDGAAFQAYTRSLLTPNDPNRPSTRDLVTGMHAHLVDPIKRKRTESTDDLLTAIHA